MHVTQVWARPQGRGMLDQYPRPASPALPHAIYTHAVLSFTHKQFTHTLFSILRTGSLHIRSSLIYAQAVGAHVVISFTTRRLHKRSSLVYIHTVQIRVVLLFTNLQITRSCILHAPSTHTCTVNMHAPHKIRYSLCIVTVMM